MSQIPDDIRETLQRGVVIPAHPLALDEYRRLDARRQIALSRYYIASGAGGLAIGVHTTQFEIRDPKIGLLRPVLELGVEAMKRAPHMIRIAGVCGQTQQAIQEASLARDLGYHAGLLSLAAMRNADDEELIAHCRTVASEIPLIGFYLQSAVGGRVLSHAFWRRFCEIENVVAIKIAPFNRYQTIDVVRAVAESGRGDIALYTGNDDNIVNDLINLFRFKVNGKIVERRIVGGLLGHWSVWTKKGVEVFDRCQTFRAVKPYFQQSERLLTLSTQVTDSNAAFFDAANGFRGCIAGLHEVLRRQGLLEGIWCLNPNETLSPGQAEEIDRVYRAYPHLNDDAFVAQHRDEWLRG